jgi:hypothetical protein
MTRVIEATKTKVPIALIRGLTWPCRKPSTLTGNVSFSPETNQAIANSSKDTAIVMKSAPRMAGAAKGMMTWRIAAHSDAPRFQAAGSSDGSICESRSRMIAIAKGAQITTCAMMTDSALPDRFTRER